MSCFVVMLSIGAIRELLERSIALGMVGRKEQDFIFDSLVARQRGFWDLGFSIILLCFGLHAYALMNIAISLGANPSLLFYPSILYIGSLLKRTRDTLQDYRKHHGKTQSKILLRSTILYALTTITTMILLYTTILATR